MEQLKNYNNPIKPKGGSIVLVVLITLTVGLIVAGFVIFLINSNKIEIPGVFKSVETPKYYSHKIAEDPQLSEEYFPVFSPDKENVIFKPKDGDAFLIPNCKICENYTPSNYADFTDKTNQLVFIGYKKSTQKFYLVIGDEVKKELSIKPDGKDTYQLVVSDDGKNYLLAEKSGEDLMIFFNGQEKGRYEETSGNINIREFIISPDGNRFGYTFDNRQKQSDERQITVVVDGKIQQFPGENLRFSPDSKHFAYVGEDNPVFAGTERNKRFIVYDGVKQKEYIDIGIDTYRNFDFTWSPNSQRFAYHAVSTKVDHESKGVLVLDGVEQPGLYSALSRFTFSPDSKRYAFFDKKSEFFADNKLSGITDLILDGKVEGHFQINIRQFDGTYFSPNSNRFVWAADGHFYEEKLEDQWISFGETVPAASYFVFSPDSQRTAAALSYTINRGYTYVDEQKFFGTDRIPIFSPDSKHVAFLEYPLPKDDVSFMGMIYPNRNELKENMDLIVNLDLIYKRNIKDPYSYLPENYYTEHHALPLSNNGLGYPLLDSVTLAFSDDSKYLKINEKKGNEYWVTVLNTETGEEVVKN